MAAWGCSGADPAAAPALAAIGERHALAYIPGKGDKTELLAELQKDTRHYAKRQLTWFRKNKDIHWFDPRQEQEIILAVEAWWAA